MREHLGVQSLMLGMNEAARFGEVVFQLGANELLLLTSDGLVESPCSDGKQFGIQGIERFLGSYNGGAVLTDLLANVRRMSASPRLEDDVSAVLVAPAGALAPRRASVPCRAHLIACVRTRCQGMASWPIVGG